jgi:hypothetical protein
MRDDGKLAPDMAERPPRDFDAQRDALADLSASAARHLLPIIRYTPIPLWQHMVMIGLHDLRDVPE